MLGRLILFIFLLGGQVCLSQSRYNFFTIGLENGLSSSNIWSINQDKNGFIWIATTNGLNRYDGHTIKQYFNDPADKNSIAGNICYWIYKDTDGDMWFACGANGLSRYNYARDNFESLALYDSAREHNRYKSPVWRFGEDLDKRIYLSCGAAVYRYDKRKGTLEDLTSLFGPNWDAGVGRFYMMKEGVMWIATDAGFYRFDVDKHQMRKIPFDVNGMGHGSEFMYDIEAANDHELLITMARAGYVVFDTETEKFRPAKDEFSPKQIGDNSEMGEVMKDSRGRIWMASSVLGLLEYIPLSNQFVYMKNEPLYPYPYPEQEGAGKAIFEDRDGNIWYGTSTQGLVRFSPDFNFLRIYSRDFSNKTSLPHNTVTAFTRNSGSTMWIGTYKGVTGFSPNTGKYINLPIDGTEAQNKYPGAVIRTLASSGDTVFIASEKGIHAFHAGFNRFINYSKGDSGDRAVDGSLRNLVMIRPGELFFLADKPGIFHTGTGRVEWVKPGSPLYRLENISLVSFDGRRKVLWVLANKELHAYDWDKKQLRKHHYWKNSDSTQQISISTIATDEEGKVWMGTSKGIICYDPLTARSQDPVSVNNVINILIEQEWIWFTTRKEIGRTNRRSGKTDLFTLQDILPYSLITPRSIKKDDDGNIWIATNQGFCVMDPDEFRSRNIPHHPQLTAFRIFDEIKYFNVSNAEIRRIDLRYRENFFSFDFSSFNFQHARGTRYAYILEGFDKDWNYTTENTASYTNVPPGNYPLKIRYANSKGEWDDMRQEIIIHIDPPFWRKAWFIILGFAVLLGAAIWLYGLRQRIIKRKKIDKTIDYFANSVYGDNSVNEICWDIARNSISQLQFEDCVVYLLDEKTQRLVQKAAFGPKNPKGNEIIDPIEIQMGVGIVGTVAQTGKPLLINDTTKEQRYLVDDQRRSSELAVPIMNDGKVIGVIDSENSRKGFYTEDHLRAMATIASISSNKIAEAQAEEYARHNEIKVLEISKMLAESQLMALRAQMNPHFVFNCLNSIQECIVTEKYGEASKYLNKFSKLFRMVLNNSGKNLVSVTEEKDVLVLYLDLEQMRFEKSFTYEMKVDEELETEEVLIPSMLLQPYVENALWHGLMHKDGDRHLEIDIKRVNEDVFRCTIEDNGIGRKRSFELKAEQSKAKRHESRGLKISSDRIDILQKQGYHATLEMKDKYDENGNATGTVVVIELSTFLKN
jgi:ligand-binding sensor domain-containing protein/putative methionine-R-sulfoxide reductase with GAF domain